MMPITLTLIFRYVTLLVEIMITHVLLILKRNSDSEKDNVIYLELIFAIMNRVGFSSFIDFLEQLP